jgi:hypothetical protein
MKVGDRVENILSDFGQPLGMKGTIIGECWRDKDEIMFNVAWDDIADDWPYSTKELILANENPVDPVETALYHLRKAKVQIAIIEGDGYVMGDDLQCLIDALEHQE